MKIKYNRFIYMSKAKIWENFVLTFLCNVVIVFTVLFSLNLINFSIGYRSAPVDGTSMVPTLNVSGKDTDLVYIRYTKNVSRGDIVALSNAINNEDIIKRVIGIAGDTIFFKTYDDGCYLILNGEKQSEPYINGRTGMKSAAASLQNLSTKEDESENFSYVQFEGETYLAYTVPEDKIFVMGDNRGNSDDSRSRGAFSTKQIIGIAVYRGKVNDSYLLFILKLFFGLAESF